MADPLGRLRSRFDRAIEWRVRDAVERSLASTNADLGAGPSTAGPSTVAHPHNTDPQHRRADEEMTAMTHDLVGRVSAGLTEQHRVLAELVEQIDRRLASLERAAHDS